MCNRRWKRKRKYVAWKPGMQVGLRITKERFSKTNVDICATVVKIVPRVCISQLLSLTGLTRKRCFRIERDGRTTKVILEIVPHLILICTHYLVCVQFIIVANATISCDRCAELVKQRSTIAINWQLTTSRRWPTLTSSNEIPRNHFTV